MKRRAVLYRVKVVVSRILFPTFVFDVCFCVHLGWVYSIVFNFVYAGTLLFEQADCESFANFFLSLYFHFFSSVLCMYFLSFSCSQDDKQANRTSNHWIFLLNYFMIFNLIHFIAYDVIDDLFMAILIESFDLFKKTFLNVRNIDEIVVNVMQFC